MAGRRVALIVSLPVAAFLAVVVLPIVLAAAVATAS